jgi:hypothetical protein
MTTKQGQAILRKLSDSQLFPQVISALIARYTEHGSLRLRIKHPVSSLLSDKYLFVISYDTNSYSLLVYSLSDWQLVHALQSDQLDEEMCLYKTKLIIAYSRFNQFHRTHGLSILDISASNPKEWKFDKPLELKFRVKDVNLHGETLYVSSNTNEITLFQVTEEVKGALTFTPKKIISPTYHSSFLTCVRTFLMPNGAMRIFVGGEHQVHVFDDEFWS